MSHRQGQEFARVLAGAFAPGRISIMLTVIPLSITIATEPNYQAAPVSKPPGGCRSPSGWLG